MDARVETETWRLVSKPALALALSAISTLTRVIANNATTINVFSLLTVFPVTEDRCTCEESELSDGAAKIFRSAVMNGEAFWMRIREREKRWKREDEKRYASE